MNEEFSLVKLMYDGDDDFIKRWETKKVAVKKDKEGLTNLAESYSQKYEKEIADGTKKRMLLIEDGKQRGLTEEESCKDLQKFIPSEDTPILNMLHFMVYEYPNINNDVKFLREVKDTDTEFDKLKLQMEHVFSNLIHDVEEQDLPELMEYIYENVTLDIFNKIKKLKALSKSDNLSEANMARKKCTELCEKFNLNFNKIPCNIE